MYFGSPCILQLTKWLKFPTRMSSLALYYINEQHYVCTRSFAIKTRQLCWSVSSRGVDKICSVFAVKHQNTAKRQGLNWGIPPDLSSRTSAFRSATFNLGSTIFKYRSGTFLLGSTNVKHGILTVRWIQCQCSTDDEYIKWTAGRDHLAVACAPGH